MFYRNPDHNGMKLRRSETFHGRLAVSLRSSGAKDIVDVRVYKHLAALRLDSGVDDRDLKRHDFFEVAIDSAGVDSVQSLTDSKD